VNRRILSVWFSSYPVQFNGRQKETNKRVERIPHKCWRKNFCFSCRRSRLRLKCDGTRAETRSHLSVKRTSPFKSAGASVQSTAGSRGVHISGSNAGYTMFRGSVKSTGYPLHSPVSPSLPLPCVTLCHHISTGIYCLAIRCVL